MTDVPETLLRPQRREGQNPGEGLVVAIDVHNARCVLLGARRDEQVGKSDAMLAAGGELAMSPKRDGEGLGVHAQVAELRKVILESAVVSYRPSAVEELEARDGTQAQLVFIARLHHAADVGGLIDEEQPHRHAVSASNSAGSTSRPARLSASRWRCRRRSR